MKTLDLSYFITGECIGGTNNPIISCTANLITANNEIIVERTNKGVFVYGNNTDNFHVVLVLNALGVLATYKNGAYKINGIEWDGTKVNLDLFI